MFVLIETIDLSPPGSAIVFKFDAMISLITRSIDSTPDRVFKLPLGEMRLARYGIRTVYLFVTNLIVVMACGISVVTFLKTVS